MVTQELLNIGIEAKRLAVIEKSLAFHELLNKRFANVNVILGDAVDLIKLVGTDQTAISTVFSALPLRSLPPEISKAVGQQIAQLLPPGGIYIQLTYSWSKQHPSIPPTLRYKSSRYLWCNLPPARLDVFERE